MYPYPGQVGIGQQMGQQIPGAMYPGMGQQMQQPSNFGPNGSVQPSQPVQGNYTLPVMQNAMRVRPVASYDEAKAVPTDFMGNLLVLTDFSHGFVYTKVLDPATNSAIFQVYKRVPESEAQPTPPQPIAQSPVQPEYDAKGEIERIKEDLNKLKTELGITDEKGN